MLIILFGNVPSTAAGERKILWNCLSWTSPNGRVFQKAQSPCDKRRFGKPKNTGADRAHHAGDGLLPQLHGQRPARCAQHRGGYFILGQGYVHEPRISRRVAGILDTLSENGCDLLIVQDSNPHEAPGYTPKYVRYLRQQRIRAHHPWVGEFAGGAAGRQSVPQWWCTAGRAPARKPRVRSLTTAITITAAICTVFL